MDVCGDVAWHQTHIVLAKKSAGTTTLEAWFLFDGGDRQGAYYVYAERLAHGV